MFVLEHWLIMALLTPALWAVGALVDSCLIGARIYRKAIDGAIVSCLFCMLPVVAIIVTQPSVVMAVGTGQELPTPAVAAGVAYAAHLYFYFRILRRLNDVSGAETFIALSVVIVPVFAWLLLGEVLPSHFYLAFFIAAVGVLLQCLPALKKAGVVLFVDMVACVLCVSLSMVLQAYALKAQGFVAPTLAFNLACFTVAAVVVVCNRRIRRRIKKLFRRHANLLLITEALGIAALLSSHRATQQGPSVSIVALIECLLPVFIIAISFVLIGLHRMKPLLSRDNYRTLLLQVRGVSSKIAAFGFLVLSLSSLLQ